MGSTATGSSSTGSQRDGLGRPGSASETTGSGSTQRVELRLVDGEGPPRAAAAATTSSPASGVGSRSAWPTASASLRRPAQPQRPQRFRGRSGSDRSPRRPRAPWPATGAGFCLGLRPEPRPPASIGGAATPCTDARPSSARSASGQACGSASSTSAIGAGRLRDRQPSTRARASSIPGTGAQVRQRPSASFQQLPHVYWRQVRQKLNVLWKASSWCAVALISCSLRASARASENVVPSDITKLRSPSRACARDRHANGGGPQTRMCSGCRSARRTTR